MAENDRKKGIFGKAVDALSSRDEKEAINELESELEKTKKEAEAAREAVKSLSNQKAASSEDKTATEQQLKMAEKKIAELELKLKNIERQKNAEASKKALAEKLARIEAEKKAAVITTHTVKAGETLSHIALKYYKHATPPYWQHLLEHNTEVLKGSEKNVRTGMELEIPELPEDLKD